MEHTTIAVDLAKSVFQVAVSHRGRPGDERASAAAQPDAAVLCTAAGRHGCLLEACGSAHHWAREIQRLGHTPRLLPGPRCASLRASQ